jgi:hypothetical protein
MEAGTAPARSFDHLRGGAPEGQRGETPGPMGAPEPA